VDVHDIHPSAVAIEPCRVGDEASGVDDAVLCQRRIEQLDVRVAGIPVGIARNP
jgi:hypothetical protein